MKQTPAAKAVQWAKRHGRPMDATVINGYLAGRKSLAKIVRTFKALRLERDNLEGALQLAEEALYKKKISPTPEQIDALAFELHTMGVHVPPRDTAFFHAAVRKWLSREQIAFCDCPHCGKPLDYDVSIGVKP